MTNWAVEDNFVSIYHGTIRVYLAGGMNGLDIIERIDRRFNW